MLYQLSDGLKEIGIGDITPGALCFGVISLDEAEKVKNRFGFSDQPIEECKSNVDTRRASLFVYDDYSFGLMNLLDRGHVLGDRDRIAFYITKDMFLLVDVHDADKSTTEIFLRAMKRYEQGTITTEKIVYAVLEQLILHDDQMLAAFEARLQKLEDKLGNDKSDDKFPKKLALVKKEVLLMRNYYEQLVDIGEMLAEDANDLFQKDDLRYFTIFTGKARRLSDHTLMLHESAVQIREAYQAQMDNRLNKIMKVLTVLTAIFQPLTLIAGWYGMNFERMPLLKWEYGYPLIICVSLAVSATIIIVFKKKKWL
ncbi:MAG: CorA family divalent cation transporter [Eubacteriales bacterium]|nr:CorA family divalent cation transporter [Eubacteriales bacterium]